MNASLLALLRAYTPSPLLPHPSAYPLDTIECTLRPCSSPHNNHPTCDKERSTEEHFSLKLRWRRDWVKLVPSQIPKTKGEPMNEPVYTHDSVMVINFKKCHLSSTNCRLIKSRVVPIKSSWRMLTLIFVRLIAPWNLYIYLYNLRSILLVYHRNVCTFGNAHYQNMRQDLRLGTYLYVLAYLLSLIYYSVDMQVPWVSFFLLLCSYFVE